MKLFGVILLAGYFLAHEREGRPREEDPLKNLLRDWAVYLVSAGFAVLIGILSAEEKLLFQPAAILLAAVLPAIVFRGRPNCFPAGAATAFCVLRWAPDIQAVATALLTTEAAALIAAFLYLGARRRMLRLPVPPLIRRAPGRLLILLGLAILLTLVYQKIIQIF